MKLTSIKEVIDIADRELLKDLEINLFPITPPAIRQAYENKEDIMPHLIGHSPSMVPIYRAIISRDISRRAELMSQYIEETTSELAESNVIPFKRPTKDKSQSSADEPRDPFNKIVSRNKRRSDKVSKQREKDNKSVTRSYNLTKPKTKPKPGDKK